MKKATQPAGLSCEHCRYWDEQTDKADPGRWGWCFVDPPVVLGIDQDEDVIVATSWTALPRFCSKFAPRTND